MVILLVDMIMSNASNSITLNITSHLLMSAESELRLRTCSICDIVDQGFSRTCCHNHHGYMT